MELNDSSANSGSEPDIIMQLLLAVIATIAVWDAFDFH